MPKRHRHRWEVWLDPDLWSHGAYVLRCAICERVHPHPITEHAWSRPGRRAAHGRPVRCSCHGIELGPEVELQCAEHGWGPHGVKVRSDNRGLRFGCRVCAREASQAREVDPEVQRRAALSYYHRIGKRAREDRA